MLQAGGFSCSQEAAWPVIRWVIEYLALPISDILAVPFLESGPSSMH